MDLDQAASDEGITEICLSEAGTSLAIGHKNGNIRVSISTPHLLSRTEFITQLQLWDFPAASQAVRLPGHKKSISALQFAHHDSRLISSAHEQRILIWNLENHSIQFDIGPTEGIPRLLVTSPHHGLFAVSYHKPHQQTLEIRDLERGAWVKRLTVESPVAKSPKTRTLEAGPERMVFTPGGDSLIVGQRKADLQVWDLSPLRLHQTNGAADLDLRCRYLTGSEVCFIPRVLDLADKPIAAICRFAFDIIRRTTSGMDINQ